MDQNISTVLLTTMFIMTAHIVLTKTGPTVTRMPLGHTQISMVTVHTVTALMKVTSIVNLPMVARHLPAAATLIDTMFMMNPTMIATMTRRMWTDLTIHIPQPNEATLQNLVASRPLLTLAKLTQLRLTRLCPIVLPRPHARPHSDPLRP